MPAVTTPLPKPRSEFSRENLTKLPELNRRRRVARVILRWLARFLVFLWIQPVVYGLENLPDEGPGLVVSNHLGDADVVLFLAISPVDLEAVTKAEIYSFPLIGFLFEMYGVIWIHRGHPDRRALRAVLQGFQEGRLIGIAPEARESLTGSLEEGTGGAAYLALKADVPIIPVTFTGTENRQVVGNIKRFRQTEVTVTIGPPFKLDQLPDWKQAVEKGTEKIMNTLSQQLPPEYRGVYG
jgi:1-acyl-sn-glycerol-3-phosphate acyltransferase